MPLRSLVSSLVLAGLAAVLLLTAPTTAQAQSLIDFLWGGSSEWGGAAADGQLRPEIHPGPDHRQLRRPPPLSHHPQGRGDQLPDRRAARAEPLAGHDHGLRQEGEPVLAADARHAEGKSQAAELGPRRPSDEPARRARHVPRRQHLPHPRHGRALDHRAGGLQGLHPHDQRGRARSLPARPRRHEGDRDLGALHRPSRSPPTTALPPPTTMCRNRCSRR